MITNINVLDNIIYKYLREIREIDISKIIKEINEMSFDNNINEKIIYYNYSYPSKNNIKIKIAKVLCIRCCNKCGNYKSVRPKKSKMYCKCKKNYTKNPKNRLCFNFLNVVK